MKRNKMIASRTHAGLTSKLELAGTLLIALDVPYTISKQSHRSAWWSAVITFYPRNLKLSTAAARALSNAE